jgi:hypothetical protein
MTSAPVRDPLANHLITPQNPALLLIDYQLAQLAGVRSMDRTHLALARLPAAMSSPAPCSARGRWVSRARPPRHMARCQPHTPRQARPSGMTPLAATGTCTAVHDQSGLRCSRRANHQDQATPPHLPGGKPGSGPPPAGNFSPKGDPL